MSPPRPLTRRALVTGASEGIGHAFARALARDGFIVTAVARNEARLQALRAELGPAHRVVAADLADDQGRDLVADLLRAEHHVLLVNNAGIGVEGEFAQTPLAPVRAMLALNCETVMTLAHSFLARAERGDVLVNVASTLAFLPMPRLAAYSGTKAFVAAFSEALWYEHRPRGVYVMALCPGITATRFQLNAGGHPEDLPSSLTQSPEQVVRFALAAIQRRSGPTRISGLKNRLFTLFARWLPRSSIIAMMGYVSRTWARVPSSKETT